MLLLGDKRQRHEGQVVGVNEGKTVVKGDMLEVYEDGQLKFIIKQNGKNIQVVPHLSVDDQICMGGIVPDWVHSQNGIRDMEKQVSGMKWKKVKKFSWE